MRSDDAGGAATFDGASARGGAGMNDEGRGRSAPCGNHAAGVPEDWGTRVRGRRGRPAGAGGAAGGLPAGCLTVRPGGRVGGGGGAGRPLGGAAARAGGGAGFTGLTALAAAFAAGFDAFAAGFDAFLTGFDAFAAGFDAFLTGFDAFAGGLDGREGFAAFLARVGTGLDREKGDFPFLGGFLPAFPPFLPFTAAISWSLRRGYKKTAHYSGCAPHRQ